VNSPSLLLLVTFDWVWQEWSAIFSAEWGDACLAQTRRQVAERSYASLTIQVNQPTDAEDSVGVWPHRTPPWLLDYYV